MTRPGWPGSSTSGASTSTRTPSGRRTSITPTSSGWTSTRCPGVGWPQIRRRGDGDQGGARGGRPGRLAEDLRLTRHPHQRPDRAALDVSRGASGGPRAGPRRRAARSGPRDLEMVEGGASRRLPRLQPERQGPDGRIGLLHPAAPRCPRLDAAGLGRGTDRRGRGLHHRHRAGPLRGDRRPGRRHRWRRRLARRAARAEPTPRGRRPR